MKYTQTTMPKTRKLVEHLVYSSQHAFERKKAKVPFMEVFSYTNLRILYLKGKLDEDGDLSQLERLQALEFLSISYAGALKIPASIVQLPALKTLELYDLSEEMYCPEMANLKHLKRLSLRYSKLRKVPDFVFQLTQLEELDLSMNEIAQIPLEIKQLKNLKLLDLSSNQLENLPIELGDLRLLETLDLRNNRLTAIPAIFSNLLALKNLNITNNQLKLCPETIRHCQQLEKFAWMGNPFGDFPLELFYLNIKALRPITHWGAQRERAAAVLKVLKNLKKLGLTTLQKQQLVAIYHNQEAGIQKISRNELLRLLPLTQRTLQFQVRTILYERGAKDLVSAPFQKGAVLLVIGKTTLKKSMLSAELKKYGIKYTAKYNEKVTHAVLGDNVKDIDSLLGSSIVLLSEQKVQDYLHEMDTPYLLEKGSADALNIEHISSLLLSSDLNNVGLGIELLKGGGVPSELLTELFIIYKLCPDKKKRKDAKELLKLNGSSALQKVLKSRKKLTGYSWSIKEFTEGTELESWKIAQYGYRTIYAEYQYSLALCMFDVPEKNAKDFAYYAITRSLGDSGYFSLSEGREVLVDYLYQHIQLTVLYSYGNKQLTYLPDGIHALVNLREFTLRGSQLKKLPDDFGQLNLKKVSLERIYFENWNDELKKLVNIQTLETVTLGLEGRDNCDALADLKQISSLNIKIENRDYTPVETDNTYLTQSIEEQIGQLIQLKRLSITADMEAIPTIFCLQMPLLEQLSIQCKKKQNELIIPRQLGNLTMLKKLSIKSNNIKGGIPKELEDLQNLEWLELQTFEGELPECLSKLSKLKHLSLRGTFTFLPSWFQNYKELEVLEIHQAAIEKPEAFAKELSNLEKLVEVNVHKKYTFGEKFKTRKLLDMLPKKKIDIRNY